MCIRDRVKIHSAVYAMNPQSAGKAAHSFVRETGVTVAEAEVMDIDEDLFRQGQVEARLYGDVYKRQGLLPGTERILSAGI